MVWWIIAIVIVVVGWSALRMTERQLRRIRDQQVEDGGAPTPPSGPTRSVGPFASESGPSGATGGTGATGVASADDEVDTNGVPGKRAKSAGKGMPKGAIW